MARTFGRRELFLTGTSTALAAVSLSGCDLLSTEPSGGKGTKDRAPAASRAKEAPMLAARVDAGELPPLAERLPSKPLVVRPLERVGTYGGTWTSALLGPGDTPWLDKTVHYDNLMRWKPDFSGVVPNIAASVDVVKDGREYVFHLRPGMRWSDGGPFTSADIVFAVRDILLNADVSPVPPGWLVADDTPVTVDAPDETTVRFTFRRPMGLFLQNLASLVGTPLTTCPRHYLEKFHQKYDENATPAAKDAGFSDWTELLAAKRSSTENPELPNLFAWVHRTALGDSNRMIAERNPYYWKTDPDGRQLPYIDKVVFDIVENDQVILLKATNGEFGLHARHINTLRNKPVLAKNRERGKYGFFELVPS
ncbi:MAG TPA: ABC transporter substrate-binding protein, partial [Actinopolymorphaceae bacterium]